MAQSVLENSNMPTKAELSGLSQAEIQERIKRGETNGFVPRVNRTYWDIIRDNVFNLFNIVLFSLLGIVLALGDYGTVFFAGISVFMNTFLGMIQEMNAKIRLDKLAALTVQNAFVIRNGERQEISMSDVVKDDILVIEPGTKAVVDGIVLKSDSLEMDEALLTGESDAVLKRPDDEIFSGSFCIAGTGLMRATRVGANSNINKLSEVAKEYKSVKTPTQKRLDIVVEICVIVMLTFVPLIFINNLFSQQPPLPFLSAVRNAVVFVTTLVPQGLVLTAILALTLGAIKISRRDTLVQKVNAVESLANATVLCFDKTGTLTKNELAVDEILPLSDMPISAIEQKLADYLANLAHQNRTATAVNDYIQQTATATGIIKENEIPFTSERKWGAIVFDNEAWVMGAPERLVPQNHPHYHASIELSQQGRRVLALSKLDTLPDSNDILEHVEPIAFIVMSDQIRDDINDTLQALRDEDIMLKVISGDNIETVKAVAKDAGMIITGAYEGAELDAMSDTDFATAVRTGNVFARVEPNTKRHIVAALQAQQEYVAMVGDGVNDVPALKQAELAIVMNDGTQISKDVADIVLLNNAMSTLPTAFSEGKEITQTIFGTTKMFLIRGGYHVAYFIFITFLGLPFPITPIQISWVTFGSLNMPAMLMTIPIIRPQVIKNYRRDVVDYIIVSGFVGSFMTTIIYVTVFFGTGRDTDVARTMVTFFVMLFNMYNVLIVMGLDIYDPSTYRKLRRAILVLTGLAIFTVVTFYTMPDLFEFTSVNIFEKPELFLIVFACFLLGTVLVASLLRHRYMLNRIWALLEKDEKSFTEALNVDDSQFIGKQKA
ncbi:MAG: HAD-IC family P-type ATPase [Phototrophicaceae bacterium]